MFGAFIQAAGRRLDDDDYIPDEAYGNRSVANGKGIVVSSETSARARREKSGRAVLRSERSIRQEIDASVLAKRQWQPRELRRETRVPRLYTLSFYITGIDVSIDTAMRAAIVA